MAILFVHSKALEDSESSVGSQDESDTKLIRKELPDFQRPDFKQIPYLIQRVNVEIGETDYLLPPEEPGQITAKVAFTRSTLDSHLSVVIFPTGRYGWRTPVERKYVVLRRHSKKTPVYFLTYAYVRQSGRHSLIEWLVDELEKQPRKSPIDNELCRGEDCDLPEWILGTCAVINHKCAINVTVAENASIYTKIIFEEDRDDNLYVDSNESESSTEDRTLSKRVRRSPRVKELITKPEIVHLPNTYDLLFMQHGKFAFRFKRSTDLERQAEEVLHILKCKNCQKLGNFYADLEEDANFNMVLGEKFLEEFNSTKMKRNRRFPWMRRAKELPYVGYGECSYMSVEPELKKPLSDEMDDVIEFYLATLRLDCHNALTNEIRGWLTSKLRFLRIVQDLSFELMPTSKLLKYKMLTPQEFDMLISALLFLKYSAVYREEAMSKPPYRLSILGGNMSSKVSFLTKLIIKVVDISNQYLQHHVIKTSRALARMLKDKFYALLLEKMLIQHKKESRRAHLYKENYRDRIQIMALKEFLIYGLSPIFRSATSTDTAFNSFYQLNENRIRYLVHSYGFDGPRKLQS
ncbi:unnamed protein product [Allacma fusca]|uniref:Uncharacterized protein n=1 Tax=Allacma fusca TaxID=39272 RepID=A0A8J2NQY9_9HEXA|nr:unnamed protein product [Allacma fusca]